MDNHGVHHLWVKGRASQHHVIKNASTIIVDTNLNRELLEYVANTYKNKVILDTVSTAKTTKVSDFIGSFQMIKPNRLEAELLVGFKINSIKQAKKAVFLLLEKGIKIVVISLGDEGVIYGTTGTIGTFKSPNRPAVNTTGAGDAFLATLIYGQLRGFDINKTIKLAAVASSLTVQSEFASNPQLNEDTLLTTFKTLKL